MPKSRRLQPKGLNAVYEDGSEGVVECDTIVNALGLKVNHDMVDELLMTTTESYAIGDSLNSDMTIDNAVATAFCYAMEV